MSYILFIDGKKVKKVNLTFQPEININSIDKFSEIVRNLWESCDWHDAEVLLHYKKIA